MNAKLIELSQLPNLNLVRPSQAQAQAGPKECIPFSLFKNGGIPKGAITEISGDAGSGKTEMVLRFLAENPALKVAWIEEDFTAYPCAFQQKQVKLERVLFVDSKDVFWAAYQVLRSSIFGVVVLSLHSCDEKTLRRIQLAAEKAHACVILLVSVPTQRNWSISVQLFARRLPSLTDSDQIPMLIVLKNKGQFL